MKKRNHHTSKAQRHDPAQRIIDMLGGVAKVSEITGKSPVSVHKWTYDKERAGTGGHIPWASAELLLKHSQENGGDLRPDHFFKSSGA